MLIIKELSSCYIRKSLRLRTRSGYHSHFLWNCPVYSERRALFLEHLKNNLGNEFEHLKNCDIAGKSHFILGTELWGSRYEELLRLVKSYIIDVWELRKSKLYGSGTGPLQYRSRPGRDTTCQGKGKLGGEKSCIVVYGSARSSECEAHQHLFLYACRPFDTISIPHLVMCRVLANSFMRYGVLA